MAINRRQLLAGTAITAGLVAVGQTAPAHGAASASPDAKSEVKLNLSSQLGIIPAKELSEKLALMEKWGFDGVELSGGIVGKEKFYADAVRQTKLKVSAICYGSLKGNTISEDIEKRTAAIDTLKKVIAAAGELKSTGVIYVPAFNKETKLGNREIRKLLLEILPPIGEFAVQHGTRLMLEPLNRKEAFFLRQLADAASICRDCNNPGVCMMGDFYHMAIEETSAMGAFLSAGSYLHHVHLASKTRVLPGQDPEDADRYLDGFRGLKAIGFHDYCSFECGCRGKNREQEIPKSMQVLRDQWAKA